MKLLHITYHELQVLFNSFSLSWEDKRMVVGNKVKKVFPEQILHFVSLLFM